MTSLDHRNNERSDAPHRLSRPNFALILAGEVGLVDRCGAPVLIRTRKARALLALLARSTGGLSRQRAVGLLWPDRAEEQARGSLRQTIYELRAHLGSDALVLIGDRMSTSPNAIRTDIGDAEAAATSHDYKALWGVLTHMEPFMLGGLDGISEELDDWLRTERSVLSARLAAFAREAAERAHAEQDMDLARTLADHALRLDRFDERSLRCAMRIDAALGDQAQMHRRYRAFESALAVEMQAKPAAETRALLETFRAPADRPATQIDAIEHPTVSDSAEPRAQLLSGQAHRRWSMLAVAAVLLLLMSGALAFLYLRPGPAAVSMIAVVPFTTLSNGSEYIATGIAEEVQDRLAHEPSVRVLGRFTASQFRAGPDVLAEARRLNVTHLLDGSVQSDGRRLHVIVRLTRASDGALMWSDRFDRQASDLFAVQSDIAAAVAARFGNPAKGNVIRRAAPLPAVYDRYLAARALMRDRRAIPLAAADRALREAIAQQADYAPTHALLAEVLMLEAEHPVSYGTLPFESTAKEARLQAELAAQLDPQLGDAQAALGLLTYSDAASLPYYRRAVALDPQRAEFHRWLGQSLMAAGHIKEALTEFQRAVVIDPLWGLSYEHLIVGLDRAGRDAEIMPTVRRFLSLSNDDRSRLQLLVTQAQIEGRLADSLRFTKRLIELAPEDRHAAFRYASALAMLGEVNAARAALSRDDWIGQLVLANRVGALAAAVRVNAGYFWEAGSGFWGVDDLLVTSGHGAVLLDAFHKRFGDVRHFRPGDTIDPLEGAALIAALRQNGQPAQAQELVSRLAQQMRSDAANGEKLSLILLDQAVLNALEGNHAQAIDALERLSRVAPELLLSVPYKPLGNLAAFHSLAGDPRLDAVSRRLRNAIDGERHKLGWPPLQTTENIAVSAI